MCLRQIFMMAIYLPIPPIDNQGLSEQIFIRRIKLTSHTFCSEGLPKIQIIPGI